MKLELGIVITLAGGLLTGSGAWYTLRGDVDELSAVQEKIVSWMDYDKCITNCHRTCAINRTPIDKCKCDCEHLRPKSN